MENFSLFNLLRALGGANAGREGDGEGADWGGGSCGDGAQAPRAEGGKRQNDGIDGLTDGGNAPPPPRDGQANVLAAVLERHEKISNRIKNRPARPPHG